MSGSAVLPYQRSATPNSLAWAQNRPTARMHATKSQPTSSCPLAIASANNRCRPNRRQTDSAAHIRPNSRTRSTRTQRTFTRRHAGSVSGRTLGSSNVNFTSGSCPSSNASISD